MEHKTYNEKRLQPVNGLVALAALVVACILCILAIVFGAIALDNYQAFLGGFLLGFGIVGVNVFSLMFAGLKTVRPNEARVLVLFGSYYGTINTPGYFYVNPFCISFSPAYRTAKAEEMKKATENAKKGNVSITTVGEPRTISLKTQTLDNQKQKVNDVLGNPIIIGAIVIWHVENPTQAVFSVENYREYLSIQTDSTIRNIARLYPYDVFCENEDDDGIRERTLRGSALEIAESMKTELQKRVGNAGLIIEEVRITHLAYAEEIAAAMLQRQQASAIIAARQKIVDGAVGMVKMAIDKLGEDNIILLDEERKAAMVSNLLVVLCGNRDAQPIINSGTIY